MWKHWTLIDHTKFIKDAKEMKFSIEKKMKKKMNEWHDIEFIISWNVFRSEHRIDLDYLYNGNYEE